MAREASITQEQVNAAAAQILAAGGKPTLRAVRDQLGGVGSMGTINRMLQEWRAGQSRVAAPDLALPAGLQRALLDHIASELAASRAPLEAELAEAQQAAADLAGENERQLSDLAECARQIEAHAAAQATAEGKAAQLVEQLATAQAQAKVAAQAAAEQIAQERAGAEAARTELAKAQLRLEAMPRLEADLATVRAELEDERKTRAGAERRAAVAEAQRDDLAERLNDSKSAAKQASEHLEKAKARAEQLGEQLAAAREKIEAGAARYKDATDRLAELHTALADAQHRERAARDELAVERGRGAELAEQLHAMKLAVAASEKKEAPAGKAGAKG